MNVYLAAGRNEHSVVEKRFYARGRRSSLGFLARYVLFQLIFKKVMFSGSESILFCKNKTLICELSLNYTVIREAMTELKSAVVLGREIFLKKNI